MSDGTPQNVTAPAWSVLDCNPSVNGGSEPVWGSDQTLYYRAGGRIHQATLGGSSLQVTLRDSLFTDEYESIRNGRTWDVFPGGREFLFVRSTARGESEVMVVLNWQQMRGPQKTDAKDR